MDHATIGPVSILAPTAYAAPGNLQAVDFGLAQLADALTAASTCTTATRAPAKSVATAREPCISPPGTRSAPRSYCPPRSSRSTLMATTPHRPPAPLAGTLADTSDVTEPVGRGRNR